MRENLFKVLCLAFLSASCGKPSDSVVIPDSFQYKDTIILTSSGLYSECCKVVSSSLVLKFPSKPHVENFNSTSVGDILFKRYKLEDGATITMTYHPSISIRYDTNAFDINLYCNTPQKSCTVSKIAEERGVKISRIHCIDSNLMCMGFGSFDGHGYTFVKIEDYRPIPNPIKEKFARTFLSSIVKKDTTFNFSKTVNGQLDTSRFDKCIGKTKGQVLPEEKVGSDELYIAIEKEWYGECIELYSLANCIADDYYNGKGFQLVTLLAPMMGNKTFERLATFIVRTNTDAKSKDERQVAFNFVDCIWIDESFAKKLYTAEPCERYTMSSK